MVLKEDPGFTGNDNFQRNLLNIVLGIIAQLCLTLLPMYIVLWLKAPLLLTVALLAIIILVLKKTWWDRLNEY
jgi:SSS family solute:Na+ symporter